MFVFGVFILLIAEVAAFIAVGDHVGFGWAVLLLLTVSALGPFMIRRVGVGVLMRTRLRLADGELPTSELLDGVMVLSGGVLICAPGFITGAIGLLLMVGPFRRFLIRVTGRHVARRIQTRSPRRWKVTNVTGRTVSSEASNPAQAHQERLGRSPRRSV